MNYKYMKDNSIGYWETMNELVHIKIIDWTYHHQVIKKEQN